MKTTVLLLLVVAVVVAGVSGRVARITGGRIANPGDIPNMAAIIVTLAQGNFFCGGSIVSRNYVMTAAQCMDE